MMREVFSFPSWAQQNGCCYKCKVTPSGIRQFGTEAPWRDQRLSHWELLARILDEGHSINPIFGAPGLTSQQFMVDWLHCCDLGVCADFLGNAFWHILEFMPGQSRDQRVSALFLKMRQYYEDHGVDSRLDNLTDLMLRKGPSKSPKLRAKAAEARGLVSFCKLITQEF